MRGRWANAGLNTGITFAKMGAGTGFKFLTSNPLDTDYGKLGQQTGKEYSEQGLGTADKFIALDDSGRAKTAAGPGLTVRPPAYLREGVPLRPSLPGPHPLLLLT